MASAAVAAAAAAGSAEYACPSFGMWCVVLSCGVRCVCLMVMAEVHACSQGCQLKDSPTSLALAPQLDNQLFAAVAAAAAVALSTAAVWGVCIMV
jgi:hypothetical protein